MDYTVYILYSLKDERLYIGYTKNIERRLEQHNLGEVSSTSYRRPLELIYTELYKNKEAAEKREKFLKSLCGSRIKKRILKQNLENKKEGSI